MSKKKELETELGKLMKSATKQTGNNDAAPKASVTGGSGSLVAGGNINISGNNTQVAGDHYEIKTEKIIKKEKVIPKQGDEHITEEQCFKLTQLVEKVVATEEKLKKKPATRATVWKALNSHVRVGMYRLIPIEKYGKAEKFLHSWLGRINNMKTAPRKNPNWRKSKYSFIKINEKKYNLTIKLQNYLKNNFSVSSISELSDEDLKKAYSRVSAWKSQAEKNH